MTENSAHELADLKRKKYRMSSKKTKPIDLDEHECLNNDSNINNLEMNSKKASFCFELDNILDFNLKFSSIELEKAFKDAYLSVNRSVYIKYLIYLIIFSLSWFLYFILDQSKPQPVLISYLIFVTIVFLFVFLFLLVIELKEKDYRRMEKKLNGQEIETKVDFKLAETDLKQAMEKVISKENDFKSLRLKFQKKTHLVQKLRFLYSKLSYFLAILVCVLMFVLTFLIFGLNTQLNELSHFIWFCESCLLVYLIYPFQNLIPIILTFCMSILFEYFNLKNQNENLIISIFVKTLLHIGLHLISIYLKLSLDLIKRDSFLKLAHMNKQHLTSQQDRKITEQMIKSIMPPLFTHVFGKPEEFKKSVNCVNQMRPLFIYPVSDISILFADIVGFTRMSSNKTAEELVYLLNDLYGRFDKLCEQAGCEKISTLGDCYYCVSGCLNGRKDHAKCCVEMGLLMVKEIEQFNRDHNVDVNMRVGVHTGSALCGFIGGKRFRFDVWSSDVTLANKMESSGRPGWVHISEDTYKKLDNKYNTEIGEKYSGKMTYFVVRDSKRETVAEAMKLSESPPQQNQSQIQNQSDEKKNECLIKLEEKTNLNLNQDDLLIEACKNLEFFQPDINYITMGFKRDEEYKFQAYLMGLNETQDSFKKMTLIKPKNLLFISMLVSFVLNMCSSTAYLLSYIQSTLNFTNYKSSFGYKFNFYLLISIYFVIFLIQSLFLIFYFIKISKLLIGSTSQTTTTTLNTIVQENMHKSKLKNNKNLLNKRIFIKYIVLHLISLIFLTLNPIYLLSTGLPIMCNINTYLDDQFYTNTFNLSTFCIFVLSLINFCSFVQLSSLFKSIIAFVFALIVCLTSVFGVCSNTRSTNSTQHLHTTLFIQDNIKQNLITILDSGLLILLIWFINRQSELVHRLSFKCDQDSNMKIQYAKEQKDLANWLIEVVLPNHVVSNVKEKKQYSRNYDCVGVLFVSLCNFSEFFEESYEGGRELLRVLNEISIDFDRMFDETKYKNVEKIKSIGSTFMIASGLSVDQDEKEKNENSHLYDLLDFALELYEKLEAFNLEAMSVCHFKFQMRMGFNCGPVTAGVIGTDRLLYDIWGDTVNVASRMDSTGQAGLIQTPEKVANMFKGNYKLYERGPIQIKGKDQMITYFLNPKENQKLNS